MYHYDDDNIYRSGVSFRRYTARIRYNEFSTKVLQVLRKNPQGLSIQQVQSMSGLSAKTAKKILARIAVEENSKYYLKVVRQINPQLFGNFG